MTYSEEFIEQALVKVHSRGARTIQSVADELGVKFEPVKRRLKVHTIVRVDVAEKERLPHEWPREEQLGAPLATHALNEEELNARRRERGIFPHHFEKWRAAFCASDSVPSKAASPSLSKQIIKLKKELDCMEKALAELAALLVLEKTSTLRTLVSSRHVKSCRSWLTGALGAAVNRPFIGY